MPRWAIRLYAHALPGLLADDQLRLLQAIAFPYLKPLEQRSAQRRLLRMARGRTEAERVPKEKFAGALVGIGIQIVTEEAT